MKRWTGETNCELFKGYFWLGYASLQISLQISPLQQKINLSLYFAIYRRKKGKMHQASWHQTHATRKELLASFHHISILFWFQSRYLQAIDPIHKTFIQIWHLRISKESRPIRPRRPHWKIPLTSQWLGRLLVCASIYTYQFYAVS